MFWLSPVIHIFIYQFCWKDLMPIKGRETWEMCHSSLEMKTLTEYLPSQYCFTLTTLAVNGREVSQKTSAASLHVPGSLGNQILRLCVLPWRAVSLQPPLGAVNAQVSLKDACWCSHCRPLKARPPPTQHIHAESDGRSQCARRHRRFRKAGLTHRSRRIQTDTPLWPRGLRGPMLQTQHSYTDRSPWAPRIHGPVQEPVSEWALGVCKQVKFNLIKSPLRDNCNFLKTDYRFWNQPRPEDKCKVRLGKRQDKCAFRTSLLERERQSQSLPKTYANAVTCRTPPHLKSSKILLWTRQYY